ncbi:hypothetical protein [Desulfurococcus amylolyticus]|uniref:hypothetical protein n=1 Tax=Desulfurococcus amylolyticus TaxID=94694 RepID=UPI0023F0831F|nr:hypothetical protein [Desulfurococcus amylolyticus]
MSSETPLERYIVFGYKTVGKKWRRRIEVSRFYHSGPVRGVKPFFEARVGKGHIASFLDSISAQYKRISDNIIVVYGSDPDYYIRRTIVYTGIRQYIDPGAYEIRELVAKMSEIETVFWYSKLIYAYENSGYWGVYRVAKSFRTLYRI